MPLTAEKLQQYYNLLKAKGLNLPDADNKMDRLIRAFDNALTTVTAIKISSPAQLFRQQLAAQAQGPSQQNPLNNTIAQQHRALMCYALLKFLDNRTNGVEEANDWIDKNVSGDRTELDLDHAMMDLDGDGEVTDFERNLVTNFLVVPENKDKPTIPSMLDVENELEQLLEAESSSNKPNSARSGNEYNPFDTKLRRE